MAASAAAAASAGPARVAQAQRRLAAIGGAAGARVAALAVPFACGETNESRSLPRWRMVSRRKATPHAEAACCKSAASSEANALPLIYH